MGMGTMLTVDAHVHSIAEAIEAAVHSRRCTYEQIARASNLTNKGVRRVARRETDPRSDTLTLLEMGLKKLGIGIATEIVHRGSAANGSGHGLVTR